jgi:hypothetical protein
MNTAVLNVHLTFNQTILLNKPSTILPEPTPALRASSTFIPMPAMVM